MRKVIIAAVCAFFALTASAQRASSSSTSFFSTEKVENGVQFGLRGGLNVATMTMTEGNVNVPSDAKVNWHVGAIVDIPLMQSLYIQTGLYLQNKGCKMVWEKSEYTANPMYLEIPVLASYRYTFSDAAQLQFNVGPYFAYGIGGKAKTSYRNELREPDEEDLFGDNGPLKRFDCGLQIGLGFTFIKHIYVGAAYEMGFTNICEPEKSDCDKVKNHNWMFSVGYTF